jgi:hypothetical protein
MLSLSAGAADIAGKWKLKAQGPDGSTIEAEVTLRWEGTTLTGSVQLPEGAAALRNVAFKDDVLTCALTYDGTDVSVKMKRFGDVLRGTYDADGPTGEVEATRVPQATNPVAGVWKLTTAGPEGDPIDVRLTLKQEQGSWMGTITSDAFYEELAVQNVKVEAGAMSFEVPTPIGTYKVTATVTGDEFSGTAVDPTGGKNPVKGGR